ncbi:MAG TPA: hypothetical protein VGG33_23680 [Polyangia bacterium]
MLTFFIEGGILMWPILVLGLLMVGSAGRYLLDGEPIRLRFLLFLGLALLATTVLAVAMDVSLVLTYLGKASREDLLLILAEGLKESSRPAILAFALLGLALDLIAIGVYRVGRRELKAAKG